MKLTMLGTGNALVTECYNTCFVLEENEIMWERFHIAKNAGKSRLFGNMSIEKSFISDPKQTYNYYRNAVYSL